MIWLFALAQARTVHLEFDAAAWAGGAAGECAVSNSMLPLGAWRGPCELRAELGADGALTVALAAEDGRRSPLPRLVVGADGRAPPLTPQNRDAAWWWEQVVGRWTGLDPRAPGATTRATERAFPALGWAPVAVSETTTLGPRVPCPGGGRARCVTIELRATPDASAYLRQLQDTWSAAPDLQGLHDQPVAAHVVETWTVLTEVRTLRPWRVARTLELRVELEGGGAAGGRVAEQIELRWPAPGGRGEPPAR